MTRFSRRSALNAIAAAVMCPRVVLRPEVDREAILRRFCGEPGPRWDIHAPFRVESLTYATDARSMVRAELSSPWESGETRLPPVAEIWTDYWRPAGEFREFSLPEFSELLMPRPKHGGSCPTCDDRRVSYGPEYPASQEEMDDLPCYDVDDNTIRDVSCGMCHGMDWRGPCDAIVAGVLMDYSRLKPIAAIPGVRVVASADRDCLLFSGDGFAGVAMGLTR